MRVLEESILAMPQRQQEYTMPSFLCGHAHSTASVSIAHTIVKLLTKCRPTVLR